MKPAATFNDLTRAELLAWIQQRYTSPSLNTREINGIRWQLAAERVAREIDAAMAETKAASKAWEDNRQLEDLADLQRAQKRLTRAFAADDKLGKFFNRHVSQGT